MGFNPFVSLVRFLWLTASGRLRFPGGDIGRTCSLGGAGRNTVFRHAVIMNGRGETKKSEAVFIVRFRVANMSAAANKRFSLIPIPFFMGLPGFCSKWWLINEKTGDFAGYYGWAKRADAERYAASFAVRFMTRRSVPGSVSYEIHDWAQPAWRDMPKRNTDSEDKPSPLSRG